MKRIFYLLLVVLGIILFSCTKESSEEQFARKMVELTKNEVLSVAYYDTHELSENDIFTLISSFLKLEDSVLTRNEVGLFKITKKTYINEQGEFENAEIATRALCDADGITAVIYEVSFKNGFDNGLAVVASDARLPSILAYIPNVGSPNSMELTGANELLRASKASYIYKMLRTKELVDSLRIPTLEKISHELHVPINEITYEKIEKNIILTDVESATRVTAVPRQPVGIQKLKTSIDPLVKTNWGQDDPYNGYFAQMDLVDWIRTENNGKNYGPVPAGCVNIAMAQMMTHTHLYAFHQLVFPIPGFEGTFTPDFDRMTRTPKIDDPGANATGRFHTQYLITDLYLINKTTSKKDWDDAVISSEVSEPNMLNTMSKYFKYDPKATFDGDKAWAALKNHNLVFMLTSDHAFIISGILITEKADLTRQLVKVNDVYWHANFGWANECTGYYQLDSNARVFFEAGGTNQWDYTMDFLNNISAK